MKVRRLFAAFILVLALFAAQNAGAQTVPVVVVTPDEVTGTVNFRLNTSTDDVRIVRACIYQIDPNAADPTVPVGCALVTSGTSPTSGPGTILNVQATVSILPQDQIFGARNEGEIEGQPVRSPLSANTAVLPFGIVSPLFVVLGSEG